MGFPKSGPNPPLPPVTPPDGQFESILAFSRRFLGSAGRLKARERFPAGFLMEISLVPAPAQPRRHPGGSATPNTNPAEELLCGGRDKSFRCSFESPF